ncbi:MAG: glycine dehydrogenase [candidate division Zixibacteria bacterium SM23_73_2]|nr:MAG: glycine dehydrogenase [candidate division Zixibacteria bacterium SM23_73_2]
MDYVPHTSKDKERMLEKIGVESLEKLLGSIPEKMRLKRDLNLPSPISELELKEHLKKLSQKNKSSDQMVTFLGGGAYDHFIPSVVEHILSRPEFYTAYTPYQAEVSQGTLQSIYEYQSLVCELTGMEVSNASMYDAGSAVAEAAILAFSRTGRKEVLVFDSTNPFYLDVLRTYTRGMDIKIDLRKSQKGIADPADLKNALSEKTAGVIIQNPNFFGLLEKVEEIEPLVHSSGALLILVCDPISLGILKPPGEYKADIAVGEGQSLGNRQNFGGPFLGYFTAKKELIRRMPGRIIGATQDHQGKRGFVMILQTREQHIRRERATSNICTNQALCALAACIYLSLLGKTGLKKVAELCLQKSHYLADRIRQTEGFKIKFDHPFFKEFVVQTPLPPQKIIETLLEKEILAGIALSQFKLGLDDCLLISVTEKRTKKQMDTFVEELRKLK